MIKRLFIILGTVFFFGLDIFLIGKITEQSKDLVNSHPDTKLIVFVGIISIIAFLAYLIFTSDDKKNHI